MSRISRHGTCPSSSDSDHQKGVARPLNPMMNDVRQADVRIFAPLVRPESPFLPGSGETGRGLASFLDLYREHFPFVWRTVGQLGVDPGAVADAVQDVFVVVHRRRADFEGRSSIRTWLFGIARRVLADYRKAQRRRPATPTEPTELDALARDDGAASKLEASDFVSALLDTLDDVKREVFVLAELEGMTGTVIRRRILSVLACPSLFGERGRWQVMVNVALYTQHPGREDGARRFRQVLAGLHVAPAMIATSFRGRNLPSNAGVHSADEASEPDDEFDEDDVDADADGDETPDAPPDPSSLLPRPVSRDELAKFASVFSIWGVTDPTSHLPAIGHDVFLTTTLPIATMPRLVEMELTPVASDLARAFDNAARHADELVGQRHFTPRGQAILVFHDGEARRHLDGLRVGRRWRRHEARDGPHDGRRAVVPPRRHARRPFVRRAECFADALDRSRRAGRLGGLTPRGGVDRHAARCLYRGLRRCCGQQLGDDGLRREGNRGRHVQGDGVVGRDLGLLRHERGRQLQQLLSPLLLRAVRAVAGSTTSASRRCSRRPRPSGGLDIVQLALGSTLRR